jgi:hypothetical protein
MQKTWTRDVIDAVFWAEFGALKIQKYVTHSGVFSTQSIVMRPGCCFSARYEAPKETKPTPSPGAMDVDVIQINNLDIPSLPPSSAALSYSSTNHYNHRLENELCFYCGSSEHWIDDCSRTTRHLDLVQR